MRHNFFSVLSLYYIAINLKIKDFEMSDKFLDTSITSHEVWFVSIAMVTSVTIVCT